MEIPCESFLNDLSLGCQNWQETSPSLAPWHEIWDIHTVPRYWVRTVQVSSSGCGRQNELSEQWPKPGEATKHISYYDRANHLEKYHPPYCLIDFRSCNGGKHELFGKHLVVSSFGMLPWYMATTQGKVIADNTICQGWSVGSFSYLCLLSFFLSFKKFLLLSVFWNCHRCLWDHGQAPWLDIHVSPIQVLGDPLAKWAIVWIQVWCAYYSFRTIFNLEKLVQRLFVFLGAKWSGWLGIGQCHSAQRSLGTAVGWRRVHVGILLHQKHHFHHQQAKTFTTKVREFNK